MTSAQKKAFVAAALKSTPKQGLFDTLPAKVTPSALLDFVASHPNKPRECDLARAERIQDAIDRKRGDYVL